jgi:quercetin dioxygenase-like cupin family protein
MGSFDLHAFRSDACVRGFSEVIMRTWAPGQVVGTHGHPFALRALVVQGEMWLTVNGAERHLVPGDAFALDADVPHEERYGAEGATYWVARRGAREASA